MPLRIQSGLPKVKPTQVHDIQRHVISNDGSCCASDFESSPQHGLENEHRLHYVAPFGDNTGHPVGDRDAFGEVTHLGTHS